MSATMTDELTDLDLDLSPTNFDDMEEYAKGAAEPTTSKKPLPGNYTLRMPAELPDGSFAVKRTKDGTAYLQITLDNNLRGEEGEGLTITAGPYAGQSARFLRITTLQKKLSRYDRATATNVPVLDAEGNQRYYNDALDLLARFGHTSIPHNVEEWKAAFRLYEGKEIPGEVFLTWTGRERGRREGDFEARLRQKDFKRADGSYTSRVERTAEVGFSQKMKGVEVTVNPGETYTIFADLALGFRAFPPSR